MVSTLSYTACTVAESCITALMVAIMGVRLWLRKYRHLPFAVSDYLTMIAIDCSSRPPGPQAMAALKKSAQLFEAQTYLWVTYLWLQKAVVLLFIQQIWGCLPWPRIWIRLACAYLILTFMATIIIYTNTCIGPVHHPGLTGRPPSTSENSSQDSYRLIFLLSSMANNEGVANCIGSKGSLISYVFLNTSTDVVLILLPIPWLIRVKRSWSKRLLLIGLFSIGLLAAGASLSRAFLPGTQTVNTIIYLFEGTLAALAANLPMIYSLRGRRARSASPAPSDPECSTPFPQPPRPRAITDTEIIGDSNETDTDTPSEHQNTRVSSQASTEPLFRRELNL
ncbi:uncharacterized protein BO97DRAFT_455043 [Aspergillus homomorphus CBS 101889]|uniref:Rhodopsin domain-containing protein n=1 Tax=Aspergillus homomorphus (strain CBS 101889) TaxID=1450537 RepID=A0A395HSY1_ASPHC|nr:hypothetical protein BO97DRAFT_455043 [Aspergillus homomorphus CBS 101889]RAL10656.1 hypothetical protein BO97DRAFT_455043 [Aspergillus homomorphus CBS 101889]